jgi:hypothetical protein
VTAAFSVRPVDEPGFSAVAHLADGVVRLTMTGTADVRAIEPLARLMPVLHDEVLRVGGKEVIVDFLAVEFMNSSCFKALVSWISQLQGVGAAQQYKVRLLSNPEVHWQRRSLRALSCFAADLVSVET